MKAVKVEYIKDYQLKVEFEDGKVNVIDFKEFLKNANNPMTSKYINLKFFKEVKIMNGILSWNDFELCFSPESIYKGKL